MFCGGCVAGNIHLFHFHIGDDMLLLPVCPVQNNLCSSCWIVHAFLQHMEWMNEEQGWIGTNQIHFSVFILYFTITTIGVLMFYYTVTTTVLFNIVYLLFCLGFRFCSCHF